MARKDDLNTLFERYGKKFPRAIHAGKAIGGKLDEDAGKKDVHVYNDWLVVLDGPVVDENRAHELEGYAHSLYGTKDEEWKAVRNLGLKTSENDVVIRLRPKSYGSLLKLSERYAKKVYEIDPVEFSVMSCD